MKVLLLEDDPTLSDIISDHLRDQGFTLTLTHTGEEALEHLLNEPYDMALLDVNVPTISGIEVLRQVREYEKRIPIIIITAYQDTHHLKQAFENEVDDYIKKPFDLEELDQRMSKICRQFNLNQTNEIIINSTIRFVPSENLILYKDNDKKIAQKESDILTYFCTHKHRTISQDELLQNLWTYDEMPTEATIRVYIKILRHLIGKEAIKTVRGIGYRFEPN